MMVGTASLPHILMRYFTTPSVREARQSVAWSLLFIFLLYFSAPAYAAFSKLEVYTNIIGRDLTSVRPWLFTWGELGLIQICGKNAASIDAIVAACKAIAGHPGVVRLAGLRHQHRRDRALHAGDRRPPVRDLRPRRGRRPRRCAVDRRRAPAGDRQRAQPRHLLQDARPQRPDHSSADGGAGSACSSWRWQPHRLPLRNRRTSWPWWDGRSRSPWRATSQLS